jgi:hypothetical protein
MQCKAEKSRHRVQLTTAVPRERVIGANAATVAGSRKRVATVEIFMVIKKL